VVDKGRKAFNERVLRSLDLPGRRCSELVPVVGQVGERHLRVITAVVQEDPRCGGSLAPTSTAFRQVGGVTLSWPSGRDVTHAGGAAGIPRTENPPSHSITTPVVAAAFAREASWT
jgi:hypothetical protein